MFVGLGEGGSVGVGVPPLSSSLSDIEEMVESTTIVVTGYVHAGVTQKTRIQYFSVTKM